MNQNFISISPTGEIHDCKIVMTPKTGDLQDYLMKAAAKVTIFEKIDRGFYVGVKSGRQSVAKIIKEISFTTFFRLHDSDNICTLALEQSAVNIKHTLVAKLPSDMIAVFTRAASGDVYIIALSMKDGCIYKLPLSNVYGDGRICMGSSYYSDESMSATETFEHAYEVFNEAVWNRDLTEHSRESDRNAMWRWDLDKEDQQFIEMPTNWERHCQPISSDGYNEMAKFILKKEGYVSPTDKASTMDDDGGLEWSTLDPE